MKNITTARLAVFTVSGVIFCGCAAPAKKAAGAAIDVTEGVSRMAIQKAKELSINRLAVFDFALIDGEASAEGKLIADRIINYLVKDGSLNIIERSRIEKILSEQELQASGIVDSATAKELGKTMGVEAVIIGTVAKFGDESEINTRLVNVQTAEIIGVFSGRTTVKINENDSAMLANEVQIEKESLEKLRVSEPKNYKAKLDGMKKISNLRNENPLLFEQLINTRNRLYKTYRQDPKKFVKMMGPTPMIPIGVNMMEVQKALNIMRECLPQDYKRLYELRKEILEVKQEKKIDRSMSRDKYYRGQVNYKENPKYNRYDVPDPKGKTKGSKTPHR